MTTETARTESPERAAPDKATKRSELLAFLMLAV
jgi:hypothetical protein